MNLFFLIASILCLILGMAHSIFGELLIFKDKRDKGQLVPRKKVNGLRVSHLGILWATWHLASFFGWAIGAVLWKLSLSDINSESEVIPFFINCTIFSMLFGSFLVLIGTKGRHPGWVILIVIGVLLILGN